MNFKNLEDKCQYYRSLTDYRLLPNSNILVMLDGKNFSRLIKNNFKKPFDDDFIDMMNQTAKFLCENVQGCKLAYVQSDEISLFITDYDTPETDTLFGGRLCKIQSILASMATSEFNKQMLLYKIKKDAYGIGTLYDSKDTIYNIKDCVEKIEETNFAQFDCKAWVVPNQNDVFAWYLYRQIDCIKNSKQQTAQTYISHKELLGKNADEQVELCKEKGIVDWNKFEDKYKYGRFIYKKLTSYTKDIKGETVAFVRNKFAVFDAFPLTENKEKFFELWKLN